MLDYFGEYPGESQMDPPGPEQGQTRVFRGGSWLFSGDFARSAARGALDPEDENAAVGFRVVYARASGSSAGGNVPSSRTWSVDLDSTADVVGDTIEFVRIEPGHFFMGSPDTEPNRDRDEGPVRRVEITQPFWVGTYETTVGQWFFLNPGSSATDPSLPIGRASWLDASDFCRVATARMDDQGILPTGYEVGLPTEAQWEYAVRAGTETAYFFGASDLRLGDYAWFRENADRNWHPVGQKLPNPWGLYDVYGNVSEWTFDFYSSRQDSNTIDPIGPNRFTWSGDDLVVKGGAYSSPSWNLRSAERVGSNAMSNGAGHGFLVTIRPIISEQAP